MRDEDFVQRCLRLIERLRERGTISSEEAVELQTELFAAVGR